MGSQSFNRAIVAGQFGFRENRVDLLVAGAAEKNDREPFVARETTLSAGTSMKTTRNKMMPRQLRDSATTQCATSRFHRPHSARSQQPCLVTAQISAPPHTSLTRIQRQDRTNKRFPGHRGSAGRIARVAAIARLHENPQRAHHVGEHTRTERGSVREEIGKSLPYGVRRPWNLSYRQEAARRVRHRPARSLPTKSLR
jgi:hypothetical protein